MSVLTRANEQSQADYQPVPEGMWRWVIGKPERKIDEKYGGYRVRFPLELHPDEKARLKEEFGEPVEGVQQSFRSSYFLGLKMGWIDKKTGQYQSTKLVDFLSAALGKEQTKKFRDWIAAGGGPPRPEDKDDQQAELALIDEWLAWWEGLEVYGTVSHREGQGTVWANFAGPMAVGSLPGQKDPEYQAHGRGKLRAMIVQAHPELAEEKGPAQQFTTNGQPAHPADATDQKVRDATKGTRTYEEVFGDEAKGTAFADQPKAVTAGARTRPATVVDDSELPF